jgi:hypothetical protein
MTHITGITHITDFAGLAVIADVLENTLFDCHVTGFQT